MTTDTSKDAARPGPHEEDRKGSIKLWQQIVASCACGIITYTIVLPFDVVKIRLQAQLKGRPSDRSHLMYNWLMNHLSPGRGPSFEALSAKNGSGRPHPRYKNVFDALVKIPKTEGVLVLWSGLGPSFLLAVPSTVLYFVSYERQVEIIKETHGGKLPLWAPPLAGSLSRVACTVLFSPLMMIRTKMQSQKMKYKEIVNALKIQISGKGYQGLWLGIGPALLRDVPFSGIYWLNYEILKNQFCYNEVSTFTFSFLAGAVSGSVAAVATAPFDVIKTMQQIKLGEKEVLNDPSAPSAKSQTTGYGIFRRIYRQNGIKGLFAGLSPRLMKVAPACAIMISSFELAKRILTSE